MRNKKSLVLSDTEYSAHTKHYEAKKQWLEEQAEHNNGWTASLEEQLQSIGERTSGLQWMHSKATVLFSYRRTVMAIITGLVASVASVGYFTQAQNCNTGNNVLKIVAAGLGALSAILVVIQQQTDWGGRRMQHKQSENGFSQLLHEIQLSLRVSPNDRGGDVPAVPYLERLQSQFDEMNNVAPEIPERIRTLYRQKIAQQPVAEAGELEAVPSGLLQHHKLRPISKTSPQSMPILRPNVIELLGEESPIITQEIPKDDKKDDAEKDDSRDSSSTDHRVSHISVSINPEMTASKFFQPSELTKQCVITPSSINRATPNRPKHEKVGSKMLSRSTNTAKEAWQLSRYHRPSLHRKTASTGDVTKMVDEHSL